MLRVCRCVEAPIQLVTLLYLMLRGILTLPWSEPLSASCVEDSLGRQEARPDHTHCKKRLFNNLIIPAKGEFGK
jgi:hypothetical protein